MKPAFRAAVFDLDGTLIDSMPLVFAAYAHALEPYCAPLSEEGLRRQMGGPPERIFEQLLADSRHVTGAMRRLEAYGAANWKRIRAFPGMLAAIDALKTAGCAVALWTGRERESAEWLLREHGLLERMQEVVCGDDMDSHKPDPAGLNEVLRRLGVPASEAVLVGDADVDLLAGATLGVRTVLICHGLGFSPELLAQAWHVVDTPLEAYARLRDELRAGGKTV